MACTLRHEPGGADAAEHGRQDRLFHDTGGTGHADFFVASQGYFRALGIPPHLGRLLDQRDTADAPISLFLCPTASAMTLTAATER